MFLLFPSIPSARGSLNEGFCSASFKSQSLKAVVHADRENVVCSGGFMTTVSKGTCVTVHCRCAGGSLLLELKELIKIIHFNYKCINYQRIVVLFQQCVMS